MNRMSARAPFSDRLTSRRGAWIALGVAVLFVVVLFGALGQVKGPSGGGTAPPGSESATVSSQLGKFPGADRQSVQVVASRSDGAALTAADISGLKAMVPALGRETGSKVGAPRVSTDRKAALISIQVRVGDTAANTKAIKGLRAVVDKGAPADLRVQVTGGPAFGADVAAAFDGADFTLLAVTIAIVAVLLILTYRSPILWLLPLIVVAIADQLADKVTAATGSALGLQFDSGIINVLVFGAGTNYALLLISRYREDLHATADHRAAMSTAWRKTAPAVLASNVTVVLALLTLTLAVIPGTHGLGVSSAIGLVIALAAVLLALPPLLVVCGRRVFWPFIPSPGTAVKQGRFWHRVASGVMRRRVVSLAGGVALLAIMTAGLAGTSVGLTQLEQFRGQSQSATGLRVLSAHFPAGEAQPTLIVVGTPKATQVAQAASRVKGVVRAQPIGASADGTLTQIMVVGTPVPGTDASLNMVTDLREATHAVKGADAHVGGPVATDLDARDGNHRDLLLIAPIILAISFLVLVGLLRSLVAPIVLIAVNLASAIAAIGAGAFLSRVLLDQHALDAQIPLLAFLFLVALGIDYTIFLVHRAHAETTAHGTEAGMVAAVTHTGAVITSAGIVLAGVFAALGVLPLVVLGQLGLIVGVGVLVDTLVVRAVIVPALFGLFGDRIWWPRRPETGPADPPGPVAALRGGTGQ